MNQTRLEKLNSIKNSKADNWRQALIKAQLKFDRDFETLLQKHANQSHPLANPEAAQIMVDRLKKFDGIYYDLYAYSVISNHVHAELDFSVQLPEGYRPGDKLENYVALDQVVKLLKGGSAYYINKLLGNTGVSLWPKRYRDRFIRGESHLFSACMYTRNNPVMAGLVKVSTEHPFTGGMSYEEIAQRQERRIYPNPADWYQKLKEYDDRHPAFQHNGNRQGT